MIIESKTLRAEFTLKGAELVSLQDQKGAQYIWQGQEKSWSGKAPIMFPICGFLKENYYYYKKDQYFMQVHGFARSCQFEVIQQSLSKITFLLKSSLKTSQHFPFNFEFTISYELIDNELKVDFSLLNKDAKRMYASFGWHPGFLLNWIANDTIDNYYLAFPISKPLRRRPVNPEGLLHDELQELKIHTNKTLSLSKDSFNEGAIVLENYPHSEISLRHITSPKSIDMKFSNFPNLALWGHSDKNFICIEPWNGLGDFVDHNQKIQDKAGINKLSSGEVSNASCSIFINN